MLTTTIRHRFEDGLRDSLGVLQRATARVTGLQAWRALLRRYGYVGQIRALEMPWGTVNGWHPHSHALLFLEGQISDEDLGDLEREAFALWEAAVIREGGRSLVAGRGLKVTRGAAAYVAKVQERDGSGWLAGSELARMDLKRGRGGSLMPFELLDLADSEEARSLWIEYVEVTRGRRAIFWSRGLRDRLEVEDISDEDVIRETETADLVFLLDGEEFDSIRDDPGALVDVLEDAETVALGTTANNLHGTEGGISAVGEAAGAPGGGRAPRSGMQPPGSPPPIPRERLRIGAPVQGVGGVT